MKQEQKKSRKTKLIALLIVVTLLAVGGLVGFLLIKHQGKPVVNDRSGMLVQEDAPVAGGDDSDAQAVFAENVVVLTSTDAQSVNNAITATRVVSGTIGITVKGESPMASLGIGDIFFLDGDETTPLGEPFIGKIIGSSTADDETTFFIESPAADEVFDVLKIDYEETLDMDDATEILTMDGVTVTKTNDLDSRFQNLSVDSYSKPSVQPLSLQGAPEIKELETNSYTFDGLLFDFDIDLTQFIKTKEEREKEEAERKKAEEAKKAGKKTKTPQSDEYSKATATEIQVYRSKTGKKYHRKGCSFIGSGETEILLSKAVGDGLTACRHCNAPTVSGIFSNTLKLEGSVGIETIDVSVNYDWDILNGNGIDTLKFNCNGNFLADARLTAGLSWELRGETTRLELPMSWLKISGLRQKLFPLAFVSFTSQLQTKMTNADKLNADTKAVPLTIGLLIYVDVDGNISAESSIYFTWRQPFKCSGNVFENGKYVGDYSGEMGESKTSWGMEFELSGDVDGHLGAAVEVYVFNVNLLEIGAVKVGVEAQGKMRINVTSNAQKADENGFSATYYARAYCKILSVDLKFNAALKLKLLGLIDFSTALNIEWSWLFQDLTIWESGTKSATRFTPGTMSYTAVTAKDADAIYYKDTNGDLIRETDTQTTLFSQGFFSICGIDESYLYILKPGESNYDIYRVSKKDGINKKVAEDVTIALTQDAGNLYYVTDFDQNTVKKLNREKLSETSFVSFNYPVRYMEAQEGNFYVVAEESDLWTSIFGGSSSYCYLVSGSGKIIEEYGKSPDVDHYFREESRMYTTYSRMLSSGYLRSTASEIYWSSKSGNPKVLTEGVSGWKPTEKGIFTTLDNDDDAGLPFRIVLYRAGNGNRIDVTEVNSDQAFFTLCESKMGNWYFFDQTDDALILYQMDANFGNKTIVKTFSLQEIPYSLTTCSMVLMDNRIYFYSMPDDKTSIVLYRYDITF